MFPESELSKQEQINSYAKWYIDHSGLDGVPSVFASSAAVTVGGMAGALLTGLFATTLVNGAGKDGLFNGGGTHLLVEQAIAIGITVAYAAGITFVLAKVLDATMGLRVKEETEMAGLDSELHGEQAYQS